MVQYDVDISINDSRWNDKIPDIKQVTKEIIKTVLSKKLSCDHVEVSCVLDNDQTLQKLNKDYRSKDKPTNVLTFCQTQPADLKTPGQYLCLGDIVIAFETMQKEAQEQKKSFLNHFTHILVHSCLHLLHYDHETNEEAAQMEALEIEILRKMGIKNPYETF